MKRLTFLLTFVLLAFMSNFAQQTGDPKNVNFIPGNHTPGANRADPDVFLQGNFVDLNISPSGSCGTFSNPVGYHGFFDRLGFVADYQKDGWAVGTPPYSGDYFMPGWPWEGWLCEFTYGGVEYPFRNCYALYLSGYGGYDGVPQTSLTNTSSGTTHSALWVGTATGGGQSLKVSQNFHFVDSDAKFMIDVTLTNVGTEPLYNVEYARAVDPDQEEDLTFDFTTSNYVGHQPDGSNNLAQVVGTGVLYGVPMALQMIHPNAKAHVVQGGLEPASTNEILDATFAPTQGSPYISDVGVAVATRIAVLNPGQSVSFPVAYILNEDEVINPPGTVPVSNWAIALMIGLIVVFTIIRFKRMN
jgi:hypothetical protein